MPSSRKKSQGKARKAPRSLDEWSLAADVNNSKQQIDNNAPQNSCRHFDQTTKYSRDDWIACNALLSQYISDLPNSSSSLQYRERNFYSILENIDKHYGKYHQFNESRQRAFKEMVLARGTQKCVEVSNEIDLVQISEYVHPGQYTAPLTPWIYMMLIIEACEQYNFSHPKEMKNHPSVMIEFARIGQVAYDCPRELIRFFHRRNSCDCLKGIYYKLKDSTKRTAFCHGCCQMRDMKAMKDCECKSAMFCSRECQVVCWSGHRAFCKFVREQLEKEEQELSDKMSRMELEKLKK